MSSTVGVQVVAPTPLVTTAETVAATIVCPPELQAAPTAQGLAVDGTVNVTGGTGTTAVTTRVRIGSVTGVLVGAALVNTPVSATGVESYTYDAIDPTLSYPNGVTYVITVQLTGASANGTVNYAEINVQPITSANG